MSKLLVITPVYNGERFIEETVVSVISARVEEMTYVVVNDGSTDRTREILARYSNDLVIIDQENSGEGSAVNRAFQSYDSDYVLVLSADDLLHPDFFRETIPILEQSPELSVVYPDWQIIDENNNVEFTAITKEYSKEELIGNMNCLPGPGALIRRSKITRSYLRDTRYRYTGDFECWLNLSLESSFKRVPKILAYWRRHDSNASIVGRNKKMADERIQVYTELLSLHRENHSLVKLINRGLSVAYFSSARLVVFDCKIPAICYLWRSFRLNPKARRDLLSVVLIISSPLLRPVQKFVPFKNVLSYVLTLRRMRRR